MKRTLAKQNHLASKISLDHPDYHEDINRADLVIDARPGPIVKVHIKGAKLSAIPFLRERQMKKLIPIFSEATVDPDLVEEGRRNLVDFFSEKPREEGRNASDYVSDFEAPDQTRLKQALARLERQILDVTSLRPTDPQEKFNTGDARLSPAGRH